MALRLAINGYGLVGRHLAQRARDCSFVELVAINDIALPSEAERQAFGQAVVWSGFAGPGALLYRDRDIDVIVEAAPFFKRSELETPVDTGLRVLMTGDLREGEPDLTLVPTINGHRLEPSHRVIALGSDRTQCLLPLLYCLDAAFGLERANILLVRPPYVGNPWGMRFAEAERQKASAQFARVAPDLGAKLDLVRVEDPNATTVQFQIDAELATAPDESELRTVLMLDSHRGPPVLQLTDSPDGNPTACHVWPSQLHLRRRRLWLTGTYAPVAGYVERVLDCLAIL